jgi:arylformamidase
MTIASAKLKGPLVWLDMDQRELDDAYDQAVYAPNREQLVKRRLANSALARQQLGEPLRLAYGPTPIEGLDVYRSKRHNAPVGIFVHGGAWRNGSAFEAAYLAEPFVHAGAHFVALDFTDVAGCPVFFCRTVVRSTAYPLGATSEDIELRSAFQPVLT